MNFSQRIICLISLSLFSLSAFACTTGHHISGIINQGKIVQLENGSLWAIPTGSQNQVANWASGDEITECDFKLLNDTRHEEVMATQMHEVK